MVKWFMLRTRSTANAYVDRILRRLVWLLPRRVIMWAGIRLWAEATQGPRSVDARTVTCSDVIRRWEGA